MIELAGLWVCMIILGSIFIGIPAFILKTMRRVLWKR